MSAFERLLLPGALNCPYVVAERYANCDRGSTRGKKRRAYSVYNCPTCHHEMRLTVGLPNGDLKKPPRYDH
jgi:hypothetical protein